MVSSLRPVVRNQDEYADCVNQRVGSTGKTVGGLLDHVGMYKPPVLIIENVAALVNPTSENWKAIKADIDSLQYVVKYFLMDSKDYGLHQRRPRAYLVAIRPSAFNLDMEAAYSLLQAIGQNVQRLKINPLSQDWVMLPDDSQIVEQVLSHMQSRETDEKEKADWFAEHISHVANLGVASNSIKVPDHVASSPWYQTLPAREQHILALHFQDSAPREEIDLTGSLGRNAKSSADESEVPCMIPNLKVWHVSRNRIKIGYEMMLHQGMPMQRILDRSKVDVSQVNDKFLADLAGNAFCAPVYTAALLATLLALPSEVRRDDSDEDSRFVETLEAEIDEFFF